MNLNKISGSSNIDAIGYDPANATMDVRFHSGHTYRYYGVSQNAHNSVVLSPSKTKALRLATKGARFEKLT